MPLKVSDNDDPHRFDYGRGCRCHGHCPQPRASGRQYHGIDLLCSGAHGEAAGAAQGSRTIDDPSGRSLTSKCPIDR
jgi:hypothetical protein